MVGQNLEQQMTKLLDLEPKLYEIFEACPYDSNRNLNKFLTEELFLEKLFVKSFNFDRMAIRLRELLTSSIANHRIIYLNGFSGSGKTTFLRYFIKYNPELKDIYIDFHKVGVNEIEESIGTAIKEQIIDFHSDNNSQRLELIKGGISKIKRNIATLHRYFSLDLKNMLLEPKNNFNSEHEIIQLIQNLNNQDAFVFFFLILFSGFKTGEKYVIYFDNLDRVEIEYLSHSFSADFAEILDRINSLSQEESVFEETIHFTRDFSFIFCLRDANNAYINSHIRDSWGNVINVLNFQFFLTGYFYKKIIDQRLQFVYELQKQNNNFKDTGFVREVCQVISRLIGDRYFETAILRLFNYDIRKIFFALFELSEKKEARDFLSKINYELYEESRYGLRGSMLYWFINYLMRENFLRHFVIDVSEIDREEGYCLLARMILIVLLSKSKYSGQLSKRNINLPNSCSLYELVKEFRFNKIYRIDEILDCLIKLFLSHKYNWVHLITIHNKKILNEASFEFELDKFEDLLENWKNKNSMKNSEIVDQLSSIHLRATHAGFAVLRYMLPHFEYYSNLTNSTNRPLFTLGFERRKGKYLFETTIDNVIRLVDSHLDLMNKFYRRKFQYQLKMNIDRFKTSNFTFKYMGNNQLPRIRGHFHSTRLLTSHIDYIDNFRVFLKHNFDERESIMIDVNSRLLNRIERYVNLFEKSPDHDVKDTFINDFRIKIKQIRESNYTDFSTRLRLNYRQY